MGNTLIQAQFYHRLEQQHEEGGEFMFDFDGDEIFHVDLEKRETVWRLPEFSTFTSFKAQGALQNMAVLKQNLEVSMKRSNRSQGTFGNSPATARPAPVATPLPLPGPRPSRQRVPSTLRCPPETQVGTPWGGHPAAPRALLLRLPQCHPR